MKLQVKCIVACYRVKVRKKRNISNRVDHHHRRPLAFRLVSCTVAVRQNIVSSFASSFSDEDHL